MIVHYRTRGFVLKENNFGEADSFFTVLTYDFGRLKLFAKGIRKIRSKLRPALGTFCLSEIEFVQGKTYKTIIDAVPINNFKILKQDLERLQTAYHITDCLEELLKGEEKDNKIWNLYMDTFLRIDSPSLQADHFFLLYYYFLWNLLTVMGYNAELHNCFLCRKKPAPGKLYFSPPRGLICEGCVKNKEFPRKKLQEINPDIIKIIRLILQKKWGTLARLKIKPFYQASLQKTSYSCLDYILDR